MDVRRASEFDFHHAFKNRHLIDSEEDLFLIVDAECALCWWNVPYMLDGQRIVNSMINEDEGPIVIRYMSPRLERNS
jgi:hypothetical protein